MLNGVSMPYPSVELAKHRGAISDTAGTATDPLRSTTPDRHRGGHYGSRGSQRHRLLVCLSGIHPCPRGFGARLRGAQRPVDALQQSVGGIGRNRANEKDRSAASMWRTGLGCFTYTRFNHSCFVRMPRYSTANHNVPDQRAGKHNISM